MPISKPVKDLISKAFNEMDDREFVGLAQLVYECILPDNNKATTTEMTTLGKQLFGGRPWGELHPSLKKPLLKSAQHFMAHVTDIFADAPEAPPEPVAAPAPVPAAKASATEAAPTPAAESEPTQPTEAESEPASEPVS
jgi:hypothetical protein